MPVFKIITPLVFCAALGACMPAYDPLVTDRADNAALRFSTGALAIPTKRPGQ